MSASTIRIVGALLPSDVMAGVLAGSVDGLTSNDYHLGGEQPKAAAARVWTHLLGVYRRYRDDLAKLPDGDAAVGVTRERWLSILLTELGYGRVPTTPAGGLLADGKAYPVSHVWGATPMHLLGWGVELDKRTPGLAGAAHRAPHAMLQELLNRTDDYLWAILSNGRALRLLRDSTTLTGQTYVEFDLESMFDAEVFADFVELYLLCHQSRVEVPDGGQPTQCWLERWRTTAVSQGVRALTLLRDGVQQALQTLGTGFLQHPANIRLRDDLANGVIRLDDVHRSLLRVVYRLLFWAVAEDRGALLDPKASPETIERYLTHFSSSRLRRLAVRRHGSAHDDLWQAVTLVMHGLACTEGEPRLGVPGLGGLFATTEADVLNGCRLGNQPLLAAVRSLSVVQPKGQSRRHVDFHNLGAEELGSIYESLLELVPRHDPTSHAYTLELLAGNDRKTSGSYYTPTDLVELVLDTALDPVLDQAEKSEDPEAGLLALKVCDPAIGSGHFMVAAARRIATRVAMVRTGEIDPTPTTISDAMHDVVARCIYGVDLNPMAADLAKVSLWLEAMTPGKPLSFLDHHIKVGNALLGTTPSLLHAGIPDEAFVALPGDDKATVNAWKKLNTKQRSGQTSIFDEGGVDVSNVGARNATEEVAERSARAHNLADITWAAQRYAVEVQSEPAVRARRTADAWCAAFLSPKTPDAVPITHEVLAQIAAGTASQSVTSATDSVATRHRAFHWHLEFPEVFQVPGHEPANTPTGWLGGFSALLGNPPWERVKLQDKEFFASRAPEVTAAPTASKRKQLIDDLEDCSPALFAEYRNALRRASEESFFIRASGAYRFASQGETNTYVAFADLMSRLVGASGHFSLICPTGIAVDSSTASLYRSLVMEERLACVYDFVTNPRVWTDVGNRNFRFCVLTAAGTRGTYPVAKYSVLRKHPDELPLADNVFELTSEEIRIVGPETETAPMFRTRRDADLVIRIMRALPVLIDTTASARGPWDVQFLAMFHMAGDSSNFKRHEELQDPVALYEAKYVHHFTHRLGTFEGKVAGTGDTELPRPSAAQLADPRYEIQPRYWVRQGLVDESLEGRTEANWLLGFRDIAKATDERTLISAAIPRVGAGHTLPIVTSRRPLHGLHAIFSSFILDFVARQRIAGAHMTFTTMRQLPVPTPESLQAMAPWDMDTTIGDWLLRRTAELTATTYSMVGYLEGTAHGGPPFCWSPERRSVLRAELDAAMFVLYGLSRDDVDYVMSEFRIVRRKDETAFGEFRTKRLVLAAYDAMAEAAATGVPFVSPLDPPPGHGPRHPEVSHD